MPSAGRKSESAASPLRSQRPTSGRNCYVTPTFSGVPKQGDKIRIGCLTPAFSGAQKRAEVLRSPCMLRGPQRQARVENQKCLRQPYLLGDARVGGSATQPLHSQGSPTPSVGRKSEMATSPRQGANNNWLPHPCLLQGPQVGGICYVTLAFSGHPNAKRGEKIRSGYLTPAFLVVHKWAELLRNPCILGGPQRQARGDDQKWLPHPYLLGDPKEGGGAMQPLHFRWSPTPRAARKSEVPTSTLPSRGPKRGRKRYVTPAFSGVPNAKRGENIRIGRLTLAFSGVHKWAEFAT